MTALDKEHYKVLKKAKKNNLDTNDLTNEQLDICEYLCEEDCMRANEVTDEDTFTTTHPTIKSFSITQRGRAQILEFSFKYHRWYIPLIISILSLIISAMAYFIPRC